MDKLTKEKPATQGINPDGSYDCNKVIKKCIYSKRDGGLIYCDYLCKTGHSRGGDPKRCFAYEQKRKGKRSNVNPFTGIQNTI